MKLHALAFEAPTDRTSVQRWINRSAVRASILGLIVTLIALPASSPAQVAPREASAASRSDGLLIRLRFQEYQGDFSDFAKSQRPLSQDREISGDLSSIAERIEDYLESTTTLLQVYSSVSREADRVRIQPIIKSQVSEFAKKIETDQSLVTTDLANTRLTTVVGTGGRMKQDMRDAKTFLDSVQSSFE